MPLLLEILQLSLIDRLAAHYFGSAENIKVNSYAQSWLYSYEC